MGWYKNRCGEPVNGMNCELAAGHDGGHYTSQVTEREDPRLHIDAVTEAIAVIRNHAASRGIVGPMGKQVVSCPECGMAWRGFAGESCGRKGCP